MGPINGHEHRTGEDLLARLSFRALDKLPGPILTALRDRMGKVIDERARQYELFEATAIAAASSPVASPLERSVEIEPAVAQELARVLSPSQVRTFLDCGARWWFKHGLKLPDPRTSKLALGIAVHEAVAENFRQKVESKRDLAQTGVVALFRGAWARLKSETIFDQDEDPAELGDLGDVLVTKYMDEAAPFIEPAAVELEVAGEINGVAARGIVDVLDVEGRVVDVKTAAKSPSGIDPGYRFQVATYAQLAPGATGAARLDTLVKAKTVKLVEQSFQVTGADLLATSVLYPLAQEAMRSGLYLPNRASNLCSRHNCPFWRRCEEEYGGEVAER